MPDEKREWKAANEKPRWKRLANSIHSRLTVETCASFAGAIRIQSCVMKPFPNNEPRGIISTNYSKPTSVKFHYTKHNKFYGSQRTNKQPKLNGSVFIQLDKHGFTEISWTTNRKSNTIFNKVERNTTNQLGSLRIQMIDYSIAIPLSNLTLPRASQRKRLN